MIHYTVSRLQLPGAGLTMLLQHTQPVKEVSGAQCRRLQSQHLQNNGEESRLSSPTHQAESHHRLLYIKTASVTNPKKQRGEKRYRTFLISISRMNRIRALTTQSKLLARTSWSEIYTEEWGIWIWNSAPHPLFSYLLLNYSLPEKWVNSSQIIKYKGRFQLGGSSQVGSPISQEGQWSCHADRRWKEGVLVGWGGEGERMQRGEMQKGREPKCKPSPWWGMPAMPWNR